MPPLNKAPEDYSICSHCGMEYLYRKLLLEREPEKGEHIEDCSPICGLCVLTMISNDAIINWDAFVKLL